MAKGRPKGSGNILSFECKHSIMSVYKALGGAEAMLAWAKTNPDKYYEILCRVLPKDVDMKVEDVTPEARVYPLGVAEEEKSQDLVH